MTLALGWEGYLGAKEALITIDKVVLVGADFDLDSPPHTFAFFAARSLVLESSKTFETFCFLVGAGASANLILSFAAFSSFLFFTSAALWSTMCLL